MQAAHHLPKPSLSISVNVCDIGCVRRSVTALVNVETNFDVLLTVRLSIILATDQINAQILVL